MRHASPEILSNIQVGDSRRFWRDLLVRHPDAWQRLRMDEVLRSTAALPPRHATAAPLSNIFVVGSFATRVTVHDQQWLACEVAEAVARHPFRRPDLPVAIIGASFAGVSAALWLAWRHRNSETPVTFKVFDSLHSLFGKHRGGECRIHPNAWEWPLDGWDKGTAGFPSDLAPLSWSTPPEGKPIGEVASTMARAIEEHEPTGRAAWFRPGVPLKGCDIQADAEGIRIRVGARWERFGAAIVCIGFGQPTHLIAANGDSDPGLEFWNTCTRFTRNRRHLVIGAGDSALMVAIQRATGRDPLHLLCRADEHGLREDLVKLGERFMDFDEQYELYRSVARDSDSVDWSARYEQALLEFLAGIRRKGTWPQLKAWGSDVLRDSRVVVVARAPLFRTRSSRINRVLCAVLHAVTQFENQPLKEKIFDPSTAQRHTGHEQGVDDDGGTPGDDDKVLAAAAGQGLASFRGEYVPQDEGVPSGFTLAEGFRWLGPAPANGTAPRLHLFGGPNRPTTALRAEELVPCVGQSHPVLLEELGDRIDVKDLVARQRDWKWY